MKLCNWENSLSETVLIAIVVTETAVSLTTIWSTNLFRKQKMLTDLYLERLCIMHIQAVDYYLF